MSLLLLMLLNLPLVRVLVDTKRRRINNLYTKVNRLDSKIDRLLSLISNKQRRRDLSLESYRNVDNFKTNSINLI